MARYFFDLVGKQHIRHDFRGRELSTPEEAHRLAELIAVDLATGPEEQWISCTVAVRNADGSELFNVPIETLCLAVA